MRPAGRVRRNRPSSPAVVALGERLELRDGDVRSGVDLLIRRYKITRTPDGDPHGCSYIAELLFARCDLTRPVPGEGVSRGEFIRTCSQAIRWQELPLDGELAWPVAAAFSGSPWWTVPDDVDPAALVEQQLDLYEARLDSFFREAEEGGHAPEFRDMICAGHHLEVFGLARARFGDDVYRRELLDGAARLTGFLDRVDPAWLENPPVEDPCWRKFYGGICHGRSGLRYLEGER